MSALPTRLAHCCGADMVPHLPLRYTQHMEQHPAPQTPFPRLETPPPWLMQQPSPVTRPTTIIVTHQFPASLSTSEAALHKTPLPTSCTPCTFSTCK